jgi:hypothetical protein
MAFAGAFETYSASNTELNHGSMFRIRDDDLQLYWHNKNSGEFYKLLRYLRTGRTLIQPRWDFGMRDKSAPYVIVKVAAGAADTSIDVFDAYNCVAGDVLENPRTKEQIRIDAIDDSDTISTAATTGYGRGFANTTGAAMVAGDYLFKLGRVIAEKGVAPTANQLAPTSDYNYVEAWAKTIQVTKMQEATKMLDGVGQRDEQYIRKIWELDEEINFALLFGKRNRVYEAEGTLYTLNGVDQQIRTNSFSGAGIAYPTWELFNEWISPSFDANSSSSEKVLFAGKNLRSVILNAARAVKISPVNYLTQLGSTVTRIDVDGGSVDIIPDYKSLTGPLSGSGFLLDMAHIEFRPYNEFDRHVIPNVQNNNEIMEIKDTVIQAGSLAMFHEKAHAKFNDFDGPFFDTV